MYFKPDLFVRSTNDGTLRTYTTVSYTYVYTHASACMAMPTTHRTNDHTTHSLALTNGSTFG